jgi:CHAP domain/Putative peptidoglycan binding domain
VTTAGQVLDLARSQIGYREAVGNRTKYGAAYGLDGYAWCAMFAWWCFTGVGASDLIPKTAYTPSMYQWYADRGRASRSPRVGSLVFYNFPDSANRIQHVGIVEAVNSDGTITTIEGNTSSGDYGSQAAGGGVWRRRRAQTYVAGYGHPAYAAPAAPALNGSHLATLAPGLYNDARVRRLQEFIQRTNWTPDITCAVDGDYGDGTARAVRAAQAQCRIGVDGIVGPDTNRAFWTRGWRG